MFCENLERWALFFFWIYGYASIPSTVNFTVFTQVIGTWYFPVPTYTWKTYENNSFFKV